MGGDERTSQHAERTVQMRIEGLPVFMDCRRLLGPTCFELAPAGDGSLVATAELSRRAAADLQARLRGLGFGGRALAVSVQPALSRSLVRTARTEDARRRRAATPGFSEHGTRLDGEGRMSLTPEALAMAMAEAAERRSVVDACCGGGGNAIAFARAGCAVTAIERDAGRLADARHNAKCYGVEGRIRFVHGDAAQLLPTLRAELLFIDPPWGAEYSRISVGIEAVPLLAALLPLRAPFSATWLKLPPSFDTPVLPDFTPSAVFGVGEGDRRRVKFLWLRSDARPVTSSR